MYYYVYRITHVVNKKHYYGKRKSKILPKEDLGIHYFSSSTDKEFILDQKNNPSNYRYKVLRVFNTPEEAIGLEIILHEKFDVGKNLSFYNKCKQTSSKFDTTGFKPSPESIEKQKASRAGFRHTDESKEKCRQAKLGNSWNIGRKHSKESIELMKIKAKKGKYHPNAVFVSIYKYEDDSIIATNVILSEWCGADKSLRSNLAATLHADRSKPSTKYNPWQAKGYYAKYLNA